MARWHERGRLPAEHRAWRIGVATLATLGVIESLYMLAYHERLIDSLACPFFGEGCDIVGRSPDAKHLGIPNTVLGGIGYALMGTLALWAGDRTPERRPFQPLGLAAASLGATAASAVLTWKQAARVKAWCFWCLTSAAINVLILPVALHDGWRALRRLLSGPS